METRSSLAAEEAMKVKRCLGALRYLWRNASSTSHDENVQTMKSFLCTSPLQESRRHPGEPQDPPVEEGEASGEDASNESEQEGGDETMESEQENDDEGGNDQCVEFDEENVGESDVGSTDSDDDDDDDDHDNQGRVVEHGVRRVENEVSDGDSLTAPTLRLGEESSAEESDSAENYPHSQVPGRGWMGKLYSKYGKFAKTVEARPTWPASVESGDKDAILKDITDEFSRRCGAVNE